MLDQQEEEGEGLEVTGRELRAGITTARAVEVTAMATATAMKAFTTRLGLATDRLTGRREDVEVEGTTADWEAAAIHLVEWAGTVELEPAVDTLAGVLLTTSTLEDSPPETEEPGDTEVATEMVGCPGEAVGEEEAGGGVEEGKVGAEEDGLATFSTTAWPKLRSFLRKFP